LRHFKFLLLCFCLTSFFKSNGQKKVSPLQHDFVKLSGELKSIDSQYILILSLTVSGDYKISVDKSRYFDHGEYTIASNRLFLQKLVRKSFVHIYTNALKQPLFTEDWDKTIKVTKQTPLHDSLNLADFYPLEIGTYVVTAEIDYWYKTTKHTARSNEISFSVTNLPKRPPFN
jgi:hypothetical protein